MKLHLGSGDVRLDGWLNVDLEAPCADLHLDLRKPLPFGDESVEYIFNEHFIEHIDRKDALSLLKECCRVLNQNGVLRLSTPNLRYLAVSYLSRNINDWGDLWQPKNPCHLMNEGMRFWGHEFLYDAEELNIILSEAGFEYIRFVPWRESTVDKLAGLESRPFHQELIIEAFKNNNICLQESIVNPEDDEPWLSLLQKTTLGQIEFLEKTIADQAKCIRNIEMDLSECNQHIVEQTNNIRNAEAELSAFRSSWCGKFKSAIQKLRQ